MDFDQIDQNNIMYCTYKNPFSTPIFYLLSLCLISCHDNGLEQKLFEKLDSRKTNIHFSNDITENLSTNENLFDFDYFYNGAGVGIGDFDNNGLQDIVFCANQKDNELYVNKGDLKFEKVSNAFGAQIEKHWSNGVSIVDINQDGWQDIYISQGGPKPTHQRANLLYINNGNLTFTESAEEYGLADKGISTQSAFFDYDKDGDLDCIVMNESSFYGLDPISFYQAVGENEKVFWENCSHIYRNDNNKFLDVTSEAGLLKPSFGLGLSVGDLNDDGWLDVYITNDYYIPDAMYINQGNGTFIDEIKDRTKQLSFYGMGVDVADINNDGFQDIFVLDMASSDHYRAKTLMKSMNVDNFRLLVNTLRFPYQYMFNSLQLGARDNQFRNIAHFGGVAKTDWSWSVLMNDYDLDGHKDILITNGYRRYALDNDFQNEVQKAKMKYSGKVPLDIKKKLYQRMPSEPLSNIVYRNNGDLTFEDKTAEWGLDSPSFSIGAATADFDNDGDLDVVINNIDEKAFLLKNNTADRKNGNYLVITTDNDEHCPKVTIDYGGLQQMVEIKSVRGYMSSSAPIAHFGLKDFEIIDKVTVEWNDGTKSVQKNVRANQTIKFTKNSEVSEEVKDHKSPKKFQQLSAQELGITFKHNENKYDDFTREILLPYQQSTLGPKVVIADFNNDGLEDILALGAAGQTNELYKQTGSGFERIQMEQFVIDKKYEDLDAVFFDLNGDEWMDIYFVTGGNAQSKDNSFYEDRVYVNNGGQSFERVEFPQLKKKNYSGKVVKKIDYDNDGDDDLIVGNRIIPQMFPSHAPSLILNNNNGQLTDVTDQVAEDLKDFGIINDIEVTDLDGDGYKDFIAVGEWSHIGVFKNTNGSFEDISKSLGLNDYKGWWYSITSFDANGDDKADFIIGNIGLNSKYSASSDKPLKVYAGDFDGNDTWDMVLSKKYKNIYVPFRGRECSSQQMPFIEEKFPTYDLFANASLEDVYGEELDGSYVAEANIFASVALISSSTGYDVKSIPNHAQLFPILSGVTIEDYVILAGNIYNTEVETPRIDMGRGIILNYANDDWKVNLVTDSGLDLGDNIKSVETLYHKGLNAHLVIGGINNGELMVYKKVNP